MSINKLFESINYYGLANSVYLFFCVIRSKLFIPKSKLIRFPIDIRGKSRINFGKGLTTGKYCRLETMPRSLMGENMEDCLIFGNNVQLNDFCHITAMKSVRIGDNVLIASKVYISDVAHGMYKGTSGHSLPDSSPINRELIDKPVCIENNVWIGDGVCVLPGVTIGQGSIIGANSVVSKNIPEYHIAVGAPATPIKRFCFKEQKWIDMK